MPMRFEQEIRRILGWTPSEIEEGRIQVLNDLPAFVIEQAKRLPGLLRESFIGFYIKRESRGYIQGFIEDVIESGEDVRTWRRGRIIVPDFSPRALMQHTVDDIIVMIRADGSQPWHQLRPDRKLWDAGELLTGAPAILRPELDYRFVPGPHVRDLLLDNVQLDPISNIDIATRRWIAANLARIAKNRTIEEFGSPRDFLAACFPDLEAVSDDALAAARGLLHEFAVFSDGATDVASVPGFRGPDDWYQV